MIITFKNPLGVMTLGCTCELHAPSHLFTAISPLHVLWSLPSSSNSSKRNKQHKGIVIKLTHVMLNLF